MIVYNEGLLTCSASVRKVWYQDSYKPLPGIDNIIPKYNLTIYINKDYAYQHLHEATND